MSLAEHSSLPILGTTIAYKELNHAMVKPVLSTHAVMLVTTTTSTFGRRSMWGILSIIVLYLASLQSQKPPEFDPVRGPGSTRGWLWGKGV